MADATIEQLEQNVANIESRLAALKKQKTKTPTVSTMIVKLERELKAAKAAVVKVTPKPPIPEGKKGTFTPFNFETQLDADGVTTTQDSDGKEYVTGFITDPTTNERSTDPYALILVPDSQNRLRKILPDQAISAVKTEFSENKKALKDQLFKAGYLSEEAYERSLLRNKGDFWDAETDKALTKALADVSLNNYYLIKNSKGQVNKLFSFKEFLAGGGGSGTGVGGPTTSFGYTKLTNKQSSDLFRDTMVELIGRAPTSAEVAKFTKEINAALAKNPSKATTSASGNSTTRTDGLDPNQFANEYVLSKIVDPEFKKNPQFEFGGQIGELRRSLKTYANNMGVITSDADINSRVLNVANKKRTAKDETSDIRKLAIQMFKPFAKRLQEDENVTVRDLAYPYIRLMADTLELDENNISLTDPYLEKAINGQNGELTSLWDFRKTLRKDPKFEFTMQARQEAAGVAQGLLQAFGYGV